MFVGQPLVFAYYGVVKVYYMEIATVSAAEPNVLMAWVNFVVWETA